MSVAHSVKLMQTVHSWLLLQYKNIGFMFGIVFHLDPVPLVPSLFFLKFASRGEKVSYMIYLVHNWKIDPRSTSC